MRHTFSGAAITTPPGAYARYDLSLLLGHGFSVAVFDSFLIVSNEVGVQVGWEADPAWIWFAVEGAVEPGFFRQLPAGTDPLAAPPEDLTRTFGVRWVTRAQLNLNLKFSFLWPYSRTTGVYRYRSFVEDDTFQRLRLQEELVFEQATALLVRLYSEDEESDEDAPTVWTYGEYTVGYVRDVGTRPNRVSAGVYVEHWPVEGIVWNVDAFYSFAPQIDGFGGILFWNWGL